MFVPYSLSHSDFFFIPVLNNLAPGSLSELLMCHSSPLLTSLALKHTGFLVIFKPSSILFLQGLCSHFFGSQIRAWLASSPRSGLMAQMSRHHRSFLDSPIEIAHFFPLITFCSRIAFFFLS